MHMRSAGSGTPLAVAAAPPKSAAANTGFSAVFARQQITDCYPSAALLLDHNVAGLYFRLHCLTASMRRVVGIAKGSAEFGRVDHDRCRALYSGAPQLRNQLISKMID
jgi:hypothetical protein